MDNNTLNHLGLELRNESSGGSLNNNLYGISTFNKNTVTYTSITSPTFMMASAPCYVTVQINKDDRPFTYTNSTRLDESVPITATYTRCIICKYYHELNQVLESGELFFNIYTQSNSDSDVIHKFNMDIPSLTNTAYSNLDTFSFIYDPFDIPSGMPILEIVPGSVKITQSNTSPSTSNYPDTAKIWLTPIDKNINNFEVKSYSRKTYSTKRTFTTEQLNIIRKYISGVGDNYKYSTMYLNNSFNAISSFYTNHISGHFA